MIRLYELKRLKNSHTKESIRQIFLYIRIFWLSFAILPVVYKILDFFPAVNEKIMFIWSLLIVLMVGFFIFLYPAFMLLLLKVMIFKIRSFHSRLVSFLIILGMVLLVLILPLFNILYFIFYFDKSEVQLTSYQFLILLCPLIILERSMSYYFKKMNIL